MNRSESGLALIVLLAVALFVGLVGLAMMNATVSEVQIAVSQSNAVQARYLAEAGVADAANHLAQDNTWTGPITQTLGGGSYTVQLDTASSQTGSHGAVKSVVSTGTVRPGTASGTSQTVRETFLVLPQAFTKAVLSNTTVSTCAAATCDTGGYTPTVSNTVLRQLGAIHANNAVTATTAVNLVANTQTVGQITARRGNVTPTTSPMGTCVACALATNQPTIPFPSFDFTHYQTQATSNGTFFTTQGAFDTYVAALVTDTSGFRTINGTVFVNTSGQLVLANTTAEQKLRINGSLIVWATGPFGDLSLGSHQPYTIVITSQNGEPAVILGGYPFYSGTGAGTLIPARGLYRSDSLSARSSAGC